ncbi:MAG: nucleotide exchange factor GrpE, partial [Paludibacter sp.]|nr:nucleotide exchange factor GrpE [Paludibacter sp.]
MSHKHHHNKEKFQEKEQEQSPVTEQFIENTEEYISPETEQITEETPKDESEDLTQQIEDLKEQKLRLMAEFDNFRRRSIKERGEIVKTAGEKILSEMLPLIDDF